MISVARKLLWFGLLAGSGFGGHDAAAAGAQPGDFRVLWLNGAALGMGYDAAAGTLTREACMGVKPLSDVQINGGGPEDGMFIDSVESRDQLISKLMVTASGEAKYAALSASARMSFVKTVKISHRDRTILVRQVVSTVETGSERLTPSPGVEAMSADLSQFRRRCGTHYVSAIIYGGELIMTLQATDSSEQRRDEFAADVRAAATAAVASGSVSASVKQTIDKLRTHDHLRIIGKKAGGGETTPYTPETFADEVRDFRKQVLANGKANVLYAIVSRYPFKQWDDKSTLVDNAASKLVAFDNKLQRMEDAVEDPEMFDVDKASLQAVVRERDRLRQVRDGLRSNIESCIYPNDQKASPNEICAELERAITPPSDAMDDTTPQRFSADCRLDPISLPSAQFRGRQKTLQGDGLVGRRMLVMFDLVPVVPQDRKSIRLQVTKRVSEPGTSKKGSEEDVHETMKDIPIPIPAGCVVAQAPKRVPTPSLWFLDNQTQTFNEGINDAKCWRVGNGLGGGPGFRAAPSSTFDCDVTFRPISDLVLAHEELNDNGNIRTRKPFQGLSWLKTAAGP